MIKKYKNRPIHQIEEAIRFEYSNKGIQELGDFCGLAFVSSNKIYLDSAIEHFKLKEKIKISVFSASKIISNPATMDFVINKISHCKIILIYRGS